ncbi:alpha/beta hydrolase, partial [Streptomyces sp. SID8455]|nr:alpha/beta hydrolase [Streptomyces sp. SID8455]
MDTRRLLRTFAIGIGTAGLLVSGCSGGGSSPSASATGTAAPDGLSSYYAQKLSWRDCGVEGFECTTMKAPKDYDKPADGDIDLAVSRKKATGPGKRIG